MAVLSGWPVTTMPKVPKVIMPTTTTTASSKMMPALCHMSTGSTIMPTEMKNTAPKRSFTGVMMRSMRSASVVPASIEPITKAPRASENPDHTASVAMPKHSPMAMMSKSSSPMKRLNFLSRLGMTKMPTVNQMMR